MLALAETAQQREAREIREHLECIRPLVEVEAYVAKDLGVQSQLAEDFQEACALFPDMEYIGMRERTEEEDNESASYEGQYA